MKFPFVAACAALVVGAAAAVTTVAQEPPTKIAFIDLTKAYDSYRKYGEVMEALNAKNKSMNVELKKRVLAIETQANDLNTLNPGTKEFAEKDRLIALEKYSFDFDKKAMRNAWEDDRRSKMFAIYKEICQEADAYMAEQGYAAIFLYLPVDADFGGNLDLFTGTRAVVARDARLDVTKEIVARLNGQLPPPPVQPTKPAVDEPKKDADPNGDPKKGK